MRKLFLFIVFTLSLYACNNHKEVQLPKVAKAHIFEIYNHSPAYIFYNPDKEQKNKALLNRNNLIMNTNWIIHADGRLSLKNLLPKLDILHKKRNKKTIHSKEGMKNFFSVLDRSKKQLGFVDYSSINYQYADQHSKFYIKTLPEFHMQYYTLTINFDNENIITVDGNIIPEDELIEFLKEQIDFASGGKKTLLYLNFDERLSFEAYLNGYLLVSRITNENIKIADKQFIYNYDKLPDCNCNL